MFFTLIGVLGAGGGGGRILPREWYTTCLRTFPPLVAQILKFPKLSSLILWLAKMTIEAR